MVNTWNPYQCMVTFNLSRSASMFESGIGRGMGFRDSNQDLLGLVHVIPERARARILDIAATQLPDGGAYHQYQPLTKRGNHDVGSGFNDDPAWLVLAVAAYVKETGDLAILDEPVPWDNAEGSATPLRDHLRRCIDFTLERLGPHGLPLIGRADWNDCLNLNVFSDQPGESFQTAPNLPGGVAESVFIAGLFVLAAREAAAIASLCGDETEACRCREAADTMTASIEAHGWDGAWYRRAYDRVGRPVGSAANDEGQVFIEPQGMMAMAGVGLEDGRTRTAIASVRERLATPHGIVLLQPAYTSYHIELGEISSYPPGYKENGGVFCHTNPWLMIAEAITGNGDGALDYYLRINPSAREAISDVHRCEPYVYAQMIAGRDAPTHGEAKNSWLTGTAAWNMVAISQWILGIRPEHDGLRVEPVLPGAWSGFRATRRFRGTTYDIEVVRRAPDDPAAGSAAAADGRPPRRVIVDGGRSRAPASRFPGPARRACGSTSGSRDRTRRGGLGLTSGEFHGRPTLCLANGALVVEVLAAAGPRIVGLGATAQVQFARQTPRHRLGDGIRELRAVRRPPAVVRARGTWPGRDTPTPTDWRSRPWSMASDSRGPRRPSTGCIQSIEVRLDPVLPSMTVLHRLHNGGSRPLELAIWPITELPLGGLALLPQRRAVAGHLTRPKMEPRPVAVLVVGRSPPPRPRWAGGRRRRRRRRAQGRLPRRLGLDRLRPGRDRHRASLRARTRRTGSGSRVQRQGAPAGASYLELEVLGPIRSLPPGASTTLLEDWEVRSVPNGTAMQMRDALALPIDSAAAC